MSGQRHYLKAPITEALIELRTEPTQALTQQMLRQVGESVASQYPREEELFQTVGQFEVRAGGTSASAQQSFIGFKRTNAEQTQVLQSRLNGLTFSRLAPYESWEPFRDETRRLWDIYREKIPPKAVVRLAVRYINRIDVPGGAVDLKEYLRTCPEVSPELPQQLDGFFMQLVLPFPELPGHALINQTIIPPPRDGVVSIVLDVDLYCSENVPQDEAGIWDFFETLHVRKNEVFEACITDSARKLFD